MRTVFSIAAVLFATSAQAECPPIDLSHKIEPVMAKIRVAPDEYAARQLGARLWELWATAPDDRAQTLLDTGMRRNREFNFEAATQAFDQLVAYCPDYAEGYNQRAYVAFLQKDYVTALADLELALERDPDHIAALAGKALTEFGLGGQEAGQETLRAALKLNPWLSERRFLIEKPGQDI